MRSAIISIKNILLNILFPPLCLACGSDLDAPDAMLCESCFDRIDRNITLVCPVCGRRLGENRAVCDHGERDRSAFPYLLGAAGWYDDPIIRASIHAYKYGGVHAAARPLANLLTDYTNDLHPRPAVFLNDPLVIPVPIHAKKERKRGFDQSKLVATEYAALTGLRYADALKKINYNDPQAKTKTHEARFANIANAFIVPDPSLIAGRNIILIDDVFTSGATMSEAAQTLKAAGAKKILALVIAKA